MSYDVDALIRLGEQVVERALAGGADVAEATARQGAHLSAKVRLGEPELVEEAGSKSIGLRVIRNQQVAVTATSDLSEAGITRFVEDALELAQLSQPDPSAGPPDPSLLSNAAQHVDLDLFDDAIEGIDAAQAIEMAKRAEHAALSADKRIDNSEGATMTRQSAVSTLVTSGGFRGAVSGTGVSIFIKPVASDGDGKNRQGSYWSAGCHLEQLEAPEEVGKEAARRTLAKLGARKLDTQEAPVVFDPDAGRAILGLLSSCVTGGSVWRKASYLAEREGDRIASDLVTVVDDPLLPRAPGSQPFDGEGLLSRQNVVVDGGVLKGFLLDSYSARKLDKQSSGNAYRGGGGGVGASTTNFFLKPGTMTPQELLKSVDGALYVTEMMGFGFNAVTGDFSRGASGFWIEKGEKVFPVSEVTISLNLDDMLKRIDMVANDLEHRTSVCTPTFRVSAMTIAGR